MRKYKIAILTSHPTQYHAPLFRELAKNPIIDLTVYFCFKIGAEEHLDEGFGKVYKWDTPVLEGYKYAFLKNISPWPSFGFLGQIHPQILREIKINKYDALISHGYVGLTYWLAFFACWSINTPLILKGEADLSKNISFAKKILKKLVLNFLFKKTSAFLYSYSLNKEFFRFYGALEDNLFFHPCAVDNNFFRAQRDKWVKNKEITKNDLGIKNDWPVVLFVGKFIPRKRVMDLLEAAKLITNQNFNILLIGDGPQKNNLQKFIKENNLGNVYFTGFKNQSELPEYYAIGDIFILPSEYDPSPKALNEIMNFQMPIIASDGVKTVSDLVRDGNSGFIYPVGDFQELAKYLEKILADEKLRLRLGQNAYNTVSKWSFEEDIKGIIRALDYVTKDNG